MIEIRNLSKTFYTGLFKKQAHRVLEKVSMTIEDSRTVGLVGRSGSGKSTLARCILRLVPADEGEVLLNGEDVLKASPERLKQLRRQLQIIFQHPYSAFNPRQALRTSISEPMKLHRMPEYRQRDEEVARLLSLVNLHPEILDRYPHQVSGGQLQRAVIARALGLKPSFLVLDEPTSMLDISVQATILDLLGKLQQELGLSYLFISHDEEVVRFMSHAVATIEGGEIKRSEIV
jgi:ABC-type glutathione transport system ATPase component